MSASIFTPELIAIISMFITLGGGMLVFGISFTNRLAHVETRLDGVDKRLDVMDESIDKRFDKIDDKFEKIDEKFEKIDGKFEKLETQLRDVIIDVTFLKGNFAAQGASPLKLTKRGIQILDSIDGQQVIIDNFEMLSAYVKNNSPTDSLFDILITGRSIIKASLNEILSKEQKDKLYAIGADRYLVLDSLSIVLKDEYVKAAIKVA